MSSNQPVTTNLQQVLADSYALYLKTHNYHWNVVGPNFKSLHELFEIQYTDLALAIDEIAERIRALGSRVPATLQGYGERTQIKAGDENNTADAMVRDLAASQTTIIASLQTLRKAAGEAGDSVSEDLANTRLEVHEKARWMLVASIGEEVSEE